MNKILTPGVKKSGLFFVIATLLLGTLTVLNFTKPTQAENERRSYAAGSYFLEIDGVEGESTDEQHKNHIDLLSYSWGKALPGVQQVLPDSGGGTGKVVFQDIHFSSRVSKASPVLMLGSASGKHFKQAVLKGTKGGRDKQDYLIVTMSDVLISSYQTTGENDSSPKDQFSLNFSRIQFEYRPQLPDGSLGEPIKTGWDVKQNKPL